MTGMIEAIVLMWDSISVELDKVICCTIHNIKVMTGMIEAIVLMWDSISVELDKVICCTIQNIKTIKLVFVASSLSTQH